VNRKYNIHVKKNEKQISTILNIHIIQLYIIFIQHVAISSAIRVQHIVRLFHCLIIKHLNVYVIIVMKNSNHKLFHLYFKIIISLLNKHMQLNTQLTIVTFHQAMTHSVISSLTLIHLISLIFLHIIVPNSYNIPVSRRFLELVKNNVGPVVYDYPIGEYK
jgi:hypothetical protein